MGLEISSEGGALHLKSALEQSRQDAETAEGVVCSEGRLLGKLLCCHMDRGVAGDTVGMCSSLRLLLKCA